MSLQWPCFIVPMIFFFSKLWVTCVALAIMGVGIAPFIVPSLADMQKTAR